MDAGDFICQTRANAAALGGTWIAWLSSSSSDAKDRIGDYKYLRMDGSLVANGKADLTDGNISNPIEINENGAVITVDPIAWTATTSLGIRRPGTCIDWTSGSFPNGQLGYNSFANAQWTEGGSRSCDNLQNLYCFEQ